MKKRSLSITFFTALLIFSLVASLNENLIACTSAIFTGKATPDGRPLMWKHRDTGEENNRIEYFKGPKYNFIALMNSPLLYNKNTTRLFEAWTGTNDTGFSIMNTASYNLKDDNVSSKMMDKEGEVMYKALGSCKTLKDFENMLDNLKRPMGVEANFGVIDAEGGAAYYEVNNDSWKKIDVTNPMIAPQGYLVYTNHSYTGRKDEGMGYIRYTVADNVIKNRIAQGGAITPEWIFSSLSRSFYHPVLGIDLIKNNDILQQGSGWFIDQDFIPRKSSTASIVIEGILPNENPLNTVMWTMLGYPPVSVAVPLWVAPGAESLPSYVVANANNNADICDLSLNVKHKIFSIKRGNGNKYMNFNLIWNADGNGWMQKLAPVEQNIMQKGRGIINNYRKNNSLPTKKELSDYYTECWDLIQYGYEVIPN